MREVRGKWLGLAQDDKKSMVNGSNNHSFLTVVSRKPSQNTSDVEVETGQLVHFLDVMGI